MDESNNQNQQPPSLEEFIIVLIALRKIKRHITAAPTIKPKNLVEQIQFYDDSSEQRIYFYINNTWRYAVLT